MRVQSEIVKDIEYIKSNDFKVCIFGCGNIGTKAGYNILKFLGLRIDYYCDNDKNKWGKPIQERIECISPNQLQKKTNIACFVMVGCVFCDKIVNQLRKYKIQIIITYQEIVLLDSVIDRFIVKTLEQQMINIDNLYNKKCAVYTCITGDYDVVEEPEISSTECDYYLISDRKPNHLSVFKWINIDDIVPDIMMDNRRKNRFCKINAPVIFSQYEYSIYVDGNIKIIGDVIKCLDKIGKSGMAAYRFPFGDCLYAHALTIVVAKVERNNLIFQQIADYFKAGMPKHYGMFECGVLVRDNKNSLCKNVMKDWWSEVLRRVNRDQISFTYCLWRNGIRYEDVGILGENIRANNCFEMINNHHYTDGKWIG